MSGMEGGPILRFRLAQQPDPTEKPDGHRELHHVLERHLRHFATVFGLIPKPRLNSESEAWDRCIAALTACVVVALP
jgi:hypothetical protein